MRRKISFLVAALIFLTCAAPTLALFGPPSAVFKGRINFVQPTNFTLLSDDNQVVRIMVAQDRKVPVEVQLGVRVEVKAVQAPDGRWYLDKFEKIGTLPGSGSLPE